MPATKNLHPNVAAFLDMLAVSEIGPKLLAVSDDGYNVIVGSTHLEPNLFTDYSKHPNKLIDLPALKIKSTAAGRYQILNKYAKYYTRTLALPDFSPVSQDKIALQLIRECKAMQLIRDGHITEAIHLCRSRWASLPGAGYGQYEHDLGFLIAHYKAAGGKVND